jgi:hypothetical protein
MLLQCYVTIILMGVFYHLIFKLNLKIVTASGTIPPSTNGILCVRNFLILYSMWILKIPSYRLWLSQAFYELCNIVCVGLYANFVVREIKTGGFVWISDGSVGIVHGFPASPGQFPYQVALVINDTYTCGGSLISSKWVLTAAQCGNQG